MNSPLVGSDRYISLTGEPILFTSGKGCKVYDQDGKEYIDFVLGVGPVILGHALPEFNEYLIRALRKGVSFPGFGAVHEQVAELFEEVYPQYKVVSLFKTSSEAVTAALRCSMLETGRKKLIRCGFLGWHDAQIAETPRWHERPGSRGREILRYHKGMRGVTGDERVFNWIDGDLASLKDILVNHGHDIALFGLDVYQLAFIPRDIILQAIELCRQYGIKILIDETKTAGRIHAGGYLANAKIDSDYIVLGKAIANGFPLSVLLGKPDLDELYREARIGGTHTKEALSPYAAIAVAEIMRRHNGYRVIANNCRNVVKTINDAVAQAGAKSLFRAHSLFSDTMFDLYLEDQVVNDIAFRTRLKQHLVANGTLIMIGHCSFVCLAHQNLDHEKLGHAIYTAVRETIKE